MAATETKVEAKEAEEVLEPLMCKSCVLKVSIHCQGCTRKVKKVLQSIEGVYCTSIDLRQQKVIVKGNVDSDTLIKKLTETGKRAELWPEQVELKKKKNKKKKKKKKGKPENKEKQSDQESSEKSNQSDDNEKEAIKVVVQDAAKIPEGGNTIRNSEGFGFNITRIGEGSATGLTGMQFQESRPEMRQTVMLPAGYQSSLAEKKVTIAVPTIDENGAANERIDGGKGGKRTKSKGQRGNIIINGNEGVTVEHAGDWNQMPVHGHGPGPGTVTILGPPNESPPRHQYPPHYHAPASPVYTDTYHTACPTTTRYGAAYYTSPQPYSYTHVYRTAGSESDSETYTSPPSYSFELFSDENPNACLVM